MKRTLAAAALCLVPCFSAHPQAASVPDAARKATAMPSRASGPFDVKLTTQAQEEKEDGVALSRMTFDKQFHGGLEGTSRGEMLTAMAGSVKGSGAYVAIEWFSGTVDGRRGTFALQHRGTMTRGAPEMQVTVVPDTGTGQLRGLTGTLAIHIEGSKHTYDFDYTLPEKP